MKRAAVDPLVYVVGAAIALVMLMLFAGKLAAQLGIISEQEECQWNLLVSAIGKTGSIIDIQTIPVECKNQDVTIGASDVQARMGRAQKEMQQLISKRQLTYTNSGAFDYFDNPNDKKQIAAWALNSLLAEQMKACWDKVLHGKVNAFDEWPPSLYENLKSTVDRFDTQKSAVTTCVLCSRIKFSVDDPLQPQLLAGPLKSFSTFVRAALVPKDAAKRTYYDYFYSGVEPRMPLVTFTAPYVSAELPVNQTLALLYVRHSQPKIAQWLEPFTPYETIGALYSKFISPIESSLKHSNPLAVNILQLTPYTDNDMGLQRCGIGLYIS